MPATFTFYFAAMGQGDCCLVQCPDQRVVVVDCGSTTNPPNLEWMEMAKLQLRFWAAQTQMRVAALILTHPDGDHYNKVVSFFREGSLARETATYPAGMPLDLVGIDEIYISNAMPDGCLRLYSEGRLNTEVYGHAFGTRSVYDVTINDEKDDDPNPNKVIRFHSDTTDPDDRRGGFREQELQPVADRAFEVLSGNTDNTDWRVDIIAGNVRQGYGGEDDRSASENNARSLVTLFTVGTKKALLCGDATFSTEKFLRQKQGNRIGMVELAQVPHHGSHTGSGEEFVSMVDPAACVVSVGFREYGYLLPRYPGVLERWMAGVANRGNRLPPHTVDSWRYAASKQALDALKNEWTSNGTDLSRVGSAKGETVWYLDQPVDGTHALAHGGSQYFILVRTSETVNLRSTSDQAQAYELTDAGVTAL